MEPEGWPSSLDRRCTSDQMEINWRTDYVGKKASKRVLITLLEVSHGHLLVTPVSHFPPQKVRD